MIPLPNELNVTSLKVALPNELWNFILSDVIGTYIHSFLLLPPSCPCWPAYYVLRSVSKRVKVLVDDVWISVIGSGEEGQRDLVKIREAILGMQGAPVPGLLSTPLIAAYACYVVALFKQEYPSEDMDHGSDDELLTADSSSDKWLQTAFVLTHDIRPRESGYLLQAVLESAVNAYMLDVKVSTAHRLIWVTPDMATEHVSLSGEDLEHLLKCVYCLLKASVSVDAYFMEYKYTVDFEAARRCLAVQQPPVELPDQYQESGDILREKTASYIALPNATWLERIATQESRKRELHRAATYGIRRQSPTNP